MTTRCETWADGTLVSYTVTLEHGDGTGTRTSYGPTGEVLATEAVACPIPVAAPPDPMDAVRAALVDVGPEALASAVELAAALIAARPDLAAKALAANTATRPFANAFVDTIPTPQETP